MTTRNHSVYMSVAVDKNGSGGNATLKNTLPIAKAPSIIPNTPNNTSRNSKAPILRKEKHMYLISFYERKHS
jgi:hypothetical protein